MLADNWQRFISPELQPDARRLVQWLTYRPFQQPDRCPYCQSQSFRVRECKGQKPSYQCHYCRKNFSQTTGTPFKGTQHAELWGDFARWRFSGLSLKNIARRLNITEYACRYRDCAIMTVMQQEYPTLYVWWQTHQARASREMTPEVAAQRAQFHGWLNEVLTCKRAPCPTCGYSSRRDGRGGQRPWFFCNPCRRGFSLLAGTPLAGMLYTEIWPSFVDNMINGDSMWQLQPGYHISTGTLHRWRKCFLAMMSTMGLDALVAWTQWQRSRGYSEATKKRRKGERAPRPSKSLFNGRGQRKIPD